MSKRSLGLNQYHSESDESEEEKINDKTIDSSGDEQMIGRSDKLKRKLEKMRRIKNSMTKKRKQESKPEQSSSSSNDNNIRNNTENNIQISTVSSPTSQTEHFKSYMFLPCNFSEKMIKSVDELLREVLHRDPYNFLTFNSCSSSDPFFVGYHVSLSKTFNIEKKKAQEFRNNLEKSLKENVTLPIFVSFKSISMYLGSNNLTPSDTKPTFAIYLAFDLTEESEKRIENQISKSLCKPSTNGKALMNESDLWFSNKHISFACRFFHDKESQVAYYRECLKQFTKNTSDNYPTHFKICSVHTAAQHLIGTNLISSESNRITASEARKEILSQVQCKNIELQIGVKTFSVPLPDVKEVSPTSPPSTQLIISFSFSDE
ncbi:hypothetical protein C9374_006656 [Naegleria lovaniensis]|uniref:Uncharacterized protein n=1 Tax=Naegleria lovaniensis TaxID=51637 RepID=A0AA88GHJ1_NAELO|nr:uncharacterized protein C9374_006656 [Naegleria lovaniensis]KAG2379539.1 hypothetical protein C9374_006656 [Naegleria lovaniensis]